MKEHVNVLYPQGLPVVDHCRPLQPGRGVRICVRVSLSCGALGACGTRGSYAAEQQ